MCMGSLLTTVYMTRRLFLRSFLLRIAGKLTTSSLFPTPASRATTQLWASSRNYSWLALEHILSRVGPEARLWVGSFLMMALSFMLSPLESGDYDWRWASC